MIGCANDNEVNIFIVEQFAIIAIGFNGRFELGGAFGQEVGIYVAECNALYIRYL